MKSHLKKVVTITLLVAAFALLFAMTTANTAYAGFGDHNGYSGGGSRLDSDSVPSAVVFLIKVVLVVILLICGIIAAAVDSIRKKINPDYKSKYEETTSSDIGGGRDQTQSAYAKDGKLPDRTDQIAGIIKGHDPDFTAPDFVSFVKRVYIDIQNAWANRDLKPVMAVMHQNLYQMTEAQIHAKIRDGVVNHLERISVNTAYLSSYRRDAQYEYVGVYLAAAMVDYQVREATGEVILGDRHTRWNLNYKMVFMRSLDVKTKKAEDKNVGHACPCCGAPLTGTAFGKCEYCGNVVTTGMYSWVLSDFGVIKDDTIDEGIQE